jgi:hypothetical protein
MQMTLEQKEAVKHLFFGALDFMSSKFEHQTFKDYVEYCKTEFTENHQISILEFNQWLEEWEVKQ